MKYCSAPWDSIHINSLGNVGLCVCPVWQNHGLSGNITKTPLRKIFASATVKKFRQSIVDQKFNYCNTNTCTNFWRMDEVDDFDFTDHLPDLPTTVMLQIERNCNLRCESCRLSNIYSNKINPRIQSILTALSTEYATFDKKVNVFIDGMGEVFVSPSYLEWLNSDTVPKCFNFNIYSNGNLITKNKELIKKLQNQIEVVQISFDAATNETYKIVRGGDFDLVKNGVKLLRELDIPVWTQYVVQNRNYREILDYVKLCQELGVERIGLQIIFRWGHMSDEWWNNNKLDNNPNIDYEFLLPALEQIKNIPNCELSGGLENIITNKDTVPIHFRSV